LAPHGFKDSTTDLAEIRAWPHTWLNYGIDTAPLLVPDIDPRHGGDKTWKDLSRRTTRHVPYTWQVRTGGGGDHIIFRNPGGIKGCVLGKGVEIKAVGGYIVGVGSLHLSGQTYQWAPGCSPADAPLADPPEWLLDEICKTQPQEGERKPGAHWQGLFNEEYRVVDGGRNDALKSISGHLLGCGVDPVITMVALKGINALCMTPPEDDAVVESIFNWTYERECKRWGAK
jgi:putative DNA primase/helicase